MPDARLLRIESLLASAHRALYTAAQEAESYTRQGLADDLHDVAAEVHRLQIAQARI